MYADAINRQLALLISSPGWLRSVSAITAPGNATP
jgi:hypothetical protein